jgi:hypothetical protein
MATDQLLTYCLAGVILLVVGTALVRKSFDPFAPVYIFLCGYFQVYVIQALSARDYALRVRGADLVTAANGRALWALVWFLAVYYSGIGRAIGRCLPKPPPTWSAPKVIGLAPLMILWGLACSGGVLAGGQGAKEAPTEEASLLHLFPMWTLIGAILLIVTGRNGDKPRPALTAAGLATSFCYIVIWMMFGRRSLPLFGVLATVCAYYVSGGKRPPKLVLAATAVVGVLVVSLAIGFRNNPRYEHNLPGFLQFVGDFRPEMVVESLNLGGEEEATRPEEASRETWEYGGFLLMMDTVPEKSDYDYGESYIRLVSTYIPRVVWRDKPYFGREKWIAAWMAGSEFKREPNFTGPSIGLMGATQLNGGAVGTVVVMAVLALLTSTAYGYFRHHESAPWVQVWWSLTYYNAWLMTVNDDPFVWFYYVYGHMIIPPVVLFYLINRFGSPPAHAAAPAARPGGAGWPVAGVHG